MKILCICQYYYPEPFRITEICEDLVKRGHKVDVVTGIPNYPMGEIYDNYKKGKKRNEKINGVSVHRCFTIARKHGAFFRFLNYYSFVISSTNYVKKLGDYYDVIFVNQLSPVLMAQAGIEYKKRYNKKLVLYCLDLWPESLIAGGINRTSLIFRYFHQVSKRIYRQADVLLVSSKSFTEYFEQEFNITNTEYLPQYAESVFSPDQCKKIANETIDLMFAGNIGVAQSIETIIKAAAFTKDIKNLRWHIVGDGSELEKCKKIANDLHLNSLFFHGRKSLKEMPSYYAIADAMLITMKKDPVLSFTLPGKIQTYMAAGKPILGAIDGETSRILRKAQCGFICEAEDTRALSESARKFCHLSCSERQTFEKNATSYFMEHFRRECIIDKIEDACQSNFHELSHGERS